MSPDGRPRQRVHRGPSCHRPLLTGPFLPTATQPGRGPVTPPPPLRPAAGTLVPDRPPATEGLSPPTPPTDRPPGAGRSPIKLTGSSPMDRLDRHHLHHRVNHAVSGTTRLFGSLTAIALAVVVVVLWMLGAVFDVASERLDHLDDHRRHVRHGVHHPVDPQPGEPGPADQDRRPVHRLRAARRPALPRPRAAAGRHHQGRAVRGPRIRSPRRGRCRHRWEDRSYGAERPAPERSSSTTWSASSAGTPSIPTSCSSDRPSSSAALIRELRMRKRAMSNSASAAFIRR